MISLKKSNKKLLTAALTTACLLSNSTGNIFANTMISDTLSHSSDCNVNVSLVNGPSDKYFVDIPAIINFTEVDTGSSRYVKADVSVNVTFDLYNYCDNYVTVSFPDNSGTNPLNPITTSQITLTGANDGKIINANYKGCKAKVEGEFTDYSIAVAGSDTSVVPLFIDETKANIICTGLNSSQNTSQTVNDLQIGSIYIEEDELADLSDDTYTGTYQIIYNLGKQNKHLTITP